MPVSSICAIASRGASAPANPAAAPTSAAPLRKSRLLLLWLSLMRPSWSKYDIPLRASRVEPPRDQRRRRAQELRPARGAEGRVFRCAARQRRQHDRRERLRQEHAPALHQPPRDTERGRDLHRRRADAFPRRRRRAAQAAPDPELTDEVLAVMRDLARDGTTMIVVTHEMRFAREVSDRVLFLHNGLIEEAGPPEEVFGAPKSERCRQFLSKYLQ